MNNSKNREIKFRVWDKTNEQWMLKSDGCADYAFIQYKSGRFSVFGISPESVEIQQSTGLKDKNNKKIYEGDIIKYHETDFFDGSFVGRDFTEPVTFENCQFFPLSLINEEDMYSLEVIGNIFENPELLK